jgi:hypothetical protein
MKHRPRLEAAGAMKLGYFDVGGPVRHGARRLVMPERAEAIHRRWALRLPEVTL